MPIAGDYLANREYFTDVREVKGGLISEYEDLIREWKPLVYLPLAAADLGISTSDVPEVPELIVGQAPPMYGEVARSTDRIGHQD